MARSRGTSRKVSKVDKGDASYYQSHKDDLEEWGSAEPAPKVTQRLDVVVSVRLSADEEAMLRRESARRNQTLSSFIRGAALEQSRTGAPSAVHLTYQVAAKTESSAFGGQIVFPGGRFELSGRPAAAESALPTR